MWNSIVSVPNHCLFIYLGLTDIATIHILYYLGNFVMICAATWQNQQNEWAPSEDSDQPGHPPSLIRIFAVRLKKYWVLCFPLSAQQRQMPSLIWVFAGAHSFCWVYVGFVILWLICCPYTAGRYEWCRAAMNKVYIGLLISWCETNRKISVCVDYKIVEFVTLSEEAYCYKNKVRQFGHIWGGTLWIRY